MKKTFLVLQLLFFFGFASQIYSLPNSYEFTDEYLVNTATAGNQTKPFVRGVGSDYFFYTYETDVSGISQLLRCTRTSTSSYYSEYTIDTATTYPDKNISSAVTANRMLYVWQSENGRDGDSDGIFGRIAYTGGSTSNSWIPFCINTTTASIQRNPAVATDGSVFLVVWESANQDSSGYAVVGRMVNEDGTFATDEFIINTSTTNDQINPRVAYNGSHFLVVWESHHVSVPIFGFKKEIFGQLIDNTGAKSGSEIHISAMSVKRDHFKPDVASYDGTFMVVWHSSTNDIFARRVLSNGTLPSDVVYVSEAANTETNASITSNGKNYLIVWEYALTAPEKAIYACCIDNNEYFIDAPFKVNQSSGYSLSNPSVASDISQNYAVVWQSELQDNDGSGIYARMVNYKGITFSLHPEPQVFSDGDTLTFEVIAQSSYPPVSYQWYKGNDPIGTNSNVLVMDNMQESDDDAYFSCVVTDQYGTQRSDYATITYQKLYNGFVLKPKKFINENTSDKQDRPAIASNGTNYMVAWELLNQSGSLWDLQGRQTDLEGNSVGSEFIISNNADNQYNTDIAFNGTYYLVVWETYVATYSYDIYAQRYQSDGTPVGSPFRVNTVRTFDQKRPKVSTDGSSFMVVWESQNGDSAGYAIKGCTIASASTTPSAEIAINQSTTGNQNKPDIAFNGSKYLVVWHTDINSAGNNYYDIKGRFLLFDGTSGGDEFLVTSGSFSTDNEVNPSVASAGTTFLVAYEDWNGDYSYGGAAARLLDSSGSIITAFQFDYSGTGLYGDSRGVKVCANQTDYLVAWEMWGGTIARSKGICAQRIYHDGSRAGEEFIVINYSYYPSHSVKNIGLGSNGSDFLVSWVKYNASNLSEGIYAKALVYTGPVLTVDASYKQAYEGENVVCRIVPEFSHGTMHYSWFYKGASYGTDSNSITIPDVQLSDNDSEYYCVVTDNDGASTTVTAQLNVNKPPLGYSISDETFLYLNDGQSQFYPAVCAGGSNFFTTYSSSSDDSFYSKLKSKLIPIQPIPLDVNSSPDDSMLFSKVAFNGTNYIAVWYEGFIKGQLFDATGAKIGSAFTISQTELTYYSDLDIASDGSSFFVVWSGSTDLWDDEDGSDVYGIIVNSNGTFATSEFTIAQSDDDDTKPHIAYNGSNFLIVWHQESYTFTGDIYAQLYTSAGTPTGSVFQLNPSAGTVDDSINICSSGTDFIATWFDSESYYELYGQKINAAGALAGSAFLITDNATSYNDVEIIATSYEILAVWVTRYGSDIAGRFLALDGTPISEEFKINTHLNGYQTDPFATYNGTSFFVGWQSTTQTKAYNSVLYKTLTYTGPYFTQHPVSQTVQEGSDVTFTVSTHDHGSVTYDWYKILGIRSYYVGTGPELVLEDVPYSSPRVYYCVATDSVGTVQSNMAILTVIADLKVVTHPQDQSTYEHEAVTFSVTANYTDVQYQWFKQGTPDIFLSGENSKDLYMENPLLADDNTYYYCRIIKGSETVYSNPAHLTVIEPEFYISIEAPDSVYGNSDAHNIGYTCNAYAHYDTGTVPINDSVVWEVTPVSVAYMQDNNLRTLLVDDDIQIILKATYTDTSLGATHWRQKTISVVNLLQVTGMLPAPDTAFSMSPDTITINFSRAINFTQPGTGIFITCAGMDDEFGNADDIGIPVTITSPNGSSYIDFDLSGSILPEGLFKIKLIELQAMNGSYLDGEFDGSFPSGNFVPGGIFEAVYSIDEYNITAFSMNSDNTVSVEWTSFKAGCFYEVVYCEDLNDPQWHSPNSAVPFPVMSLNWTGDKITDGSARLYKVIGMIRYISSVSPNTGHIGDQDIDVTIDGYNTSWDLSAVAVDMGDGITVEYITVINVSQLIVRIDISASAQVGLRNVTVTTASGETVLKRDGFDILE